jgi:hypothetical protein
MTKSFQERFNEDRRLAILRLLKEQPDYSINDSMLQTALEALGHGQSRDVIKTDMAWLGEQGLVEVDVVHETVHVAKITGRGIDVAAGRATVPGVKRPAP